MPWATWYEHTTGAGFGEQQHLREPVRQHRRRQPGQVDLRRPGPRAGRRHRAGSVAEHPHRPGRRESRRSPAAPPSIRPSPVRGSPGRRRQPPADRRREPDLRRAADRSRRRQLRRRQAGRRPGRRPRPGDRRLLLAADRHPARRDRRRGSEPERRSDPQRDRARHRVHGSPTTAFRGSSGTRSATPDSAGLHNNEMVFAAKGVSDGVTANGGFHWVAVGNALPGDARHAPGPTASARARSPRANEAAVLAEQQPGSDAEDPQVAAGTMNSAQPDGAVGGVGRDTSAASSRSFVSRLVGTGATAHFQIANGGNADLDRQRRRHPAGHHVLGQHAVRHLASERRRRLDRRVPRPLRERREPDVRARREQTSR